MPRPVIEIPSSPQKPFPLKEESHIVSGFGRGSSDLGIPTANVPIASLSDAFKSLDTGVYFGFCQLIKDQDKAGKSETKHMVVNQNVTRDIDFNFGNELQKSELDSVYPHVMSIGWNPFYNNKEKTAELHIMNKFGSNFYGAKIKFNILGYIRPELDYTTKEALIEDIQIDIDTALGLLNNNEEYKKFKQDL